MERGSLILIVTVIICGMLLVFGYAIISLAARRAKEPHAMDFSQVEAKYQRFKVQFEAGALTEEEFKAQLEELMIQDGEGKWWIIGYETGQWYYHDGEKWVQAEPPKPTLAAPPTPAAEVPSAPRLFQEEGFLLHFLPTLVAAGIVELLGFLGLGFFSGFAYRLPFLLGAVVTFGLWVVLRQKVIHRWLMILILAASWMLIGMMEYLLYGYRWGDLMFMFVFNASVIFALSYGLSFIVTMLLRARPASKQ
ncbi:MAG: hypothetical protein H8E90_05355 [Anaerolineales bacterium]|nr:hypothetical protein [Anaerolineales bacterium]